MGPMVYLPVLFSIKIHRSWIIHVGRYTIPMDLLDLWSLIQGNCFNDIYSRDAGCRELAKVRFCHRVEAPLTNIELKRTLKLPTRLFEQKQDVCNINIGVAIFDGNLCEFFVMFFCFTFMNDALKLAF